MRSTSREELTKFLNATLELPGQHMLGGELQLSTLREVFKDAAMLSLSTASKPVIDNTWKSKHFSHTRYAEVIAQTLEQIEKLSTLKGGEYAGDEDRLANFRRNAITLGLLPEQVWAVYTGKHWDAVMQYVKDRGAGKQRPRAEPLTGRLDDIIVYCILMKCVYEEAESTLQQPQQPQQLKKEGE